MAIENHHKERTPTTECYFFVVLHFRKYTIMAEDFKDSNNRRWLAAYVNPDEQRTVPGGGYAISVVPVKDKSETKGLKRL
jgi:hypothetical protein